MIPGREFDAKATRFGIFLTTIELDYAQNWLLAYLTNFNMALKGGTGIKKVYFKDYRFSDDLDFTLIDTYEQDELERMLKETLLHVTEESGIQFQDTITLTPRKNGFETKVKFIGPRTRNPRSIKIDLTLPANEIILLPVTEREILHDYSDSLSVSVKSYALEEIVAEKIRSLFQRARARDMYDLWRLADTVDKAIVHSILSKKFEIKDVLLDINSVMKNRDTLSSAWRDQLGHQMKDLPDFEEVFTAVLSIVDSYEKMGNSS